MTLLRSWGLLQLLDGVRRRSETDGAGEQQAYPMDDQIPQPLDDPIFRLKPSSISPLSNAVPAPRMVPLRGCGGADAAPFATVEH